MLLQPPTTEKKPKVTEINGDRLVDDYFWLREKTNPAVIAHLNAENAYSSAVMKPTEALQDKLYNEILSHIKETDETVPYRWGDYFYYSRTVKGQQYPIYCRKQGSVEAPEQILLDLNEMAKNEKFMSIGSFAPSDDGNILAYSTDNTGFTAPAGQATRSTAIGAGGGHVTSLLVDLGGPLSVGTVGGYTATGTVASAKAVMTTLVLASS